MWSIATPRAPGSSGLRRCQLLALGLVAIAAIPALARAQLQPLLVRHVSFKGNHAVDPDVLAASIVTTQSDFFARTGLVRSLGLGQKRFFNQTEFIRDIFRIEVVFRRSGYPDATVDTVVKRSPGAVDVTFKITEGRPVRLHSFTIDGLDSVENAWQVRIDLPIRVNDVASDYKVHEASDTITLRLRNRGYPTAYVDFVEQEHGARENARLIAHPGRYSTFGAITVRDSGGTVDTAYAAALILARPGDEYRVNKIVESQRALYTSDLYAFATVNVDAAHFTANDSVVPIAVKVVPGPGHRAKASVGYGTDDCLRTGVGWTARNFPGSVLVFDVTGQLSKIGVGSPLGFGLDRNLCATLRNDSIGSREANYGLNASLRRNAFLAPANSAVLSLFATQHSEFEVYLRREFGASFSVTRSTSANVPITIAYRIASGTTSANPASFCAFFLTCQAADIAALQERRFQGTLTLSAIRQRVNNPLDPFRGSILSASATVSSRFLGSSTTQQFTRFIGDAAIFVPVTRRTILAGHLRAGLILAPETDLGDSTRGSFVPPDQRFYAGGANDVRGYDQNELGPLVYVVPADSVKGGVVPTSATRVAPTGGTRLLVGNLEARMPTPLFAGRLRFAVFVDAGALWRQGEPSTIRVTPGVGLRYSSPLGPIRFDLGYNSYALQAGPLFAINRDGTLSQLQTDYVKARSQNWTLHFSIGQAF